LKTFGAETCPKPETVDCKAFKAFLISPSAVKMIASSPERSYETDSREQTS
jgi:hypothetical protein